MGVRLMVGTAKGGFWVTSDDRREWSVRGPFFKGWKVTAGLRLADGRFMAAVASDIYGPALHVSADGERWEQLRSGPAYPDGSDARLRQVWTLRENRGTLYAGVQDAGLFTSTDGGESWDAVAGLNEHETRGGWVPGAGGLCCHALLFDHTNPRRFWCGISAVGVFRTDDGGSTWTPKNQGVPVALEDEDHKGIGTCVHALAQDPDDPELIYRQDHLGMFRSRDGADNWDRNESGLAASFGFPIVIDRASRTLFAVPLEADQYRVPVGGALQVFRSTDGGDSWHSASAGLPAANSFGIVLRGAMAVDNLDPGGVYFGTTSGSLHVSSDLGESWTNLPAILPRILHVSALGIAAHGKSPRCVRPAMHPGPLLMATVTVSLPSLLDPVTGGVRELTASGATLREVFADLVDREPRLKPHLFNEAGELRRHVLCFHNGTNTRWLDGWDGPVADGDTVLFMQAVSGG